MPTTTDYINQLKTDKSNLVNNLIEKGIEATQEETFTSLVPKVLDITGGGGGNESDNRPVYQGTRPAGWIRLPDYENVKEREYYCLVLLYPYGTNELNFSGRWSGTCYLDFGHTENGNFVADTEALEFEGRGSSNDTPINITVNYDDFPLYELEDNMRQIVCRFRLGSELYRFNRNKGNHDNVYGGNRGIVDIISPVAENTFAGGGGANLKYWYCMDGGCPTSNTSPMYIDTPKDFILPYNYMERLVKFLKPVKMQTFSETFRNDYLLTELEIDISEVTSWNNPFRNTCYSLSSLKFINGENLTSFPGDINLAYSNLYPKEVKEFFETLPDISTSGTARTITLTNTPTATEGMPDETIAIATAKNWTIAN